jgi:membrane-bound lytic murein transglycosylase D
MSAVYVVKRGDTLARIASMQHTTIGALMKMNHMRLKDTLFAGQRLRVRAEENRDGQTGMASKARRDNRAVRRGEVTVYRVKKGDTLFEIAQRFNTSVDVLISLNHMKRTDSLYVDRKLKLPRNPS